MLHKLSFGYLLAFLVIISSGGGAKFVQAEPQNSAALEEDTAIANPVFNCHAIHQSEDFANFESGPVRPLALSPDGKLLFVANTPANCLEIFQVQGKKLKRVSAVPVGMEPVAVAVRNQSEVWVVNHLSDSVSIIDVNGRPSVIRTLMVGDEPCDIVFAGRDRERAFITTAHRGQHHQTYRPNDFRTPGIGRADVWVYDAQNIGGGLSGKPLTILSLFADTPRALAVSPDGSLVYAASFLSGNKTTTVFSQAVDKRKAEPNDSADGVEAPKTGLIVKHNGEHWVDELGQVWDEEILFNLPDKDVFVIDAQANPPAQVEAFSSVGTVLFNMVANPKTGSLYVSNTEALNEVRFEGPGTRSTTVRGHYVENRVTVIKDGKVTPLHLNSHIDFSLPQGSAVPAEEKSKSLAQPMDMVVARNSEALYLAAFSSGKIARINTADLESGKYNPDETLMISVPGGPSGLLLDAPEKHLFVYSRFTNQLSIIDAEKNALIESYNLYNPEPDYIKDGRPFLYDAVKTSSNGTVSCGSCHVFGDFDGLAWDLGNPDATTVLKDLLESPGNLEPLNSMYYHPLKGPMTTQTLRGISYSGAMHWRGDRTGTNPEIIDGVMESQAAAAFKEFNGAFVSLVGREEVLNSNDLQKFTDFALSIQSPPNPIRNLDNSLTERQKAGEFDYFNAPLDRGISNCNSCHILDEENGFFGTDALLANEGPLVSQDIKIPHLRNMYQKVGMFGTSFLSSEFMGDQIRGFGYTHDGAFATLDDFIFTFAIESEDQALRMSEFMMAFNSENAPIVGQQVTLGADSIAYALPQLRLLMGQASQGACDLIAQGMLRNGSFSGIIGSAGFVHSKKYPPMKAEFFQKPVFTADGFITFSCLPVGTGHIFVR